MAFGLVRLQCTAFFSFSFSFSFLKGIRDGSKLLETLYQYIYIYD
ncbi:MAG: hypothetical protein N7Q72_03275 [Spiroplasma sp. Tabriz.8]|nr:hypothetical protein [Spiroplasma sp. Tabriz.8]